MTCGIRIAHRVRILQTTLSLVHSNRQSSSSARISADMLSSEYASQRNGPTSAILETVYCPISRYARTHLALPVAAAGAFLMLQHRWNANAFDQHNEATEEERGYRAQLWAQLAGQTIDDVPLQSFAKCLL